jgi:integrase
MAEKPEISTPGLRWRPRKGGFIPYWMPSPAAVAAKYPSGAVNLQSLMNSPADLVARCEFLQAQMQEWLSGQGHTTTGFDNTIRAVIDLYQTHPDSPYHKLKPGTLRPYAHYLGKIRFAVGSRDIMHVTGNDVIRWHADWTSNGRHVAAGQMAASVLKAALTFCRNAGYRQCQQLRDDISNLRLASPRPRSMYATAADVIAARKAAHSLGLPSAALCYALQFETALRLWDVAGQWHPLDSPVVSAVIQRGAKWAGLEWRHIGSDFVLRYAPTKTEHSTAVEVILDLRLCPMVLEELAHFPLEKRSGPVIVFERTGVPYNRANLNKTWAAVRKTAGLSDQLWGRDLRASAITEARAAGTTTDDASRVAGHSKPRITAAVYDRAKLEAHQRFQGARVGKRAANEPEND